MNNLSCEKVLAGKFFVLVNSISALAGLTGFDDEVPLDSPHLSSSSISKVEVERATNFCVSDTLESLKPSPK